MFINLNLDLCLHQSSISFLMFSKFIEGRPLCCCILSLITYLLTIQGLLHYLLVPHICSKPTSTRFSKGDRLLRPLWPTLHDPVIWPFSFDDPTITQVNSLQLRHDAGYPPPKRSVTTTYRFKTLAYNSLCACLKSFFLHIFEAGGQE